MTVSQAVEEVARALRGNPLCLALIVLVAIAAAFGYFYVSSLIDARARVLEALIASCMDGPP